jgi:uncharacterized protein YuzE
MNKSRMTYFEKDDILHLVISDDPEAGSVEINPNITAELNAKGELIGIEILSASSFIRDSMLDTVQARVLDLADAKTKYIYIRRNEMPVKDIAKQVIDALPDEATMDDIMNALYIKTKFERGEREIREGKGIPHSEARQRLQRWCN